MGQIFAKLTFICAHYLLGRQWVGIKPGKVRSRERVLGIKDTYMSKQAERDKRE